MKRWMTLCLIMIMTSVLAGCTQLPRRVAVVDFQNLTGDENLEYLGKAVAEYETTYLANSGIIMLLDRQDIYDGFAEINSAPTEVVRLERLQNLGKKVNTRYIVVGSVSRLDNNFVLMGRLFNVAEGQVIPGSASTFSCEQEYEIYYRAQNLGAALARQLTALGAIDPVPAAKNTE